MKKKEGVNNLKASKVKWMSYVLIFAGIYNLIWGLISILFPFLYFDFAEIRRPVYPEIWQCVGMVVGVYGIGYIIAAKNPYKHWVIVFVGLLGKIFGPIGFFINLTTGVFPISFGILILFNDLIWWVPFGVILFSVYSKNRSNNTE
tara:strand:- start:837 stop:1274 length:438 start_codon:yes stop_codon:yes gene_type:complete